MKEEKAINQLLSLIDDRKSFITKDGDNEIYRDDMEALKIGIDAIRERKQLRQRLVSSAAAEMCYVTEHCPHCDNEATVAWLPSEDGHSLFCPYCGERIMLCSECPVRNCEAECDWDSTANGSEEPVCFWDDRFRPKQQSFEYKGYTLVQELSENFHYSIFEGNSDNAMFCFHAACTKKIESQEEAQKHIDSYLSIRDKILKGKWEELKKSETS